MGRLLRLLAMQLRVQTAELLSLRLVPPLLQELLFQKELLPARLEQQRPDRVGQQLMARMPTDRTERRPMARTTMPRMGQQPMARTIMPRVEQQPMARTELLPMATTTAVATAEADGCSQEGDSKRR